MADTATQEQEPTTAAGSAIGETQQLTRTGAIQFGLVPRNFDEAWRMASVFADSDMVPKDYKAKPGNILVAMQYGAEIGLPPMASLQSVAVINGKPGVYGDGFLGVIMATPAYVKHVEYYELADGTKVKSLRQGDLQDDETKAVALFWRKGNPEPFEASFSIGDAKRAKLWGKDGPWSNYPARQMKWRARGFAGRDAFAAELRGIRTAEELHDSPPDDDIITETIPMGPPAEPIRRSEKAAAAAGTPDAPAPNSPAPPAPAAAPAPAASSRPASKPAKPAVPAASPKPSTFQQAAPPTTTPNVIITETCLVTLKDAPPHYEIKAERHEEGGKVTPFVFLTEDEPLYKLAASCEGTGALFKVTWHAGKRRDASTCKVLTALEAAN